jgi:hypothetical protein
MKNNFFCKKTFLCLKKLISKKFQKTNYTNRFPDPDYLWSNFMKNNFFRKKTFLCVKKLILKKFLKTDHGFEFLDLKNLCIEFFLRIISEFHWFSECWILIGLDKRTNFKHKHFLAGVIKRQITLSFRKGNNW